MDAEVKARIEARVRANCLSTVRRRLLAAWIDVRTFSGLESLAEPIEDAFDTVSKAWRNAHREAGDEAPEEELRTAIEAAVKAEEGAEVGS